MAQVVSEEQNGAVVHQVTDDAYRKSNIYCELPYCSADSSRFVFQRQNPDGSPNRTEYVACEFGSWEAQVIGRGLGGPGMTHRGLFFYRRVVPGSCQELVRLDLGTLESRVVYEFPESLETRGLGTISPDENYYAYGVTISYAPKMFGIELVDLARGTREVINTDPDICNPHTQFEPTHGKQVMVQHNRGCEFAEDGTRLKLVGEEGATEYLLSIPDGQVTRLQVGPPYTPPITGHEAWIAGTESILMSVRAEGDYSPENGNLVRVQAGGAAATVSSGYRFNHVGTSPCGGYFFCDDWHGASKLVIGSIETGTNAVVCEAHTSRGRSQDTHGHPYLSPDLKWLVFNSDRPGEPQIHVASVPPEMIKALSGS